MTPSWAPDSKRLVFLDDQGKPFIVDLATKKSHKLADVHGVRPFWSPDGKTILIIAGTRSYLYNLKSHTVAFHSWPKGYYLIGWSPDSRGLLYTKETLTSTYPLYVYDITTGMSQRLPGNDSGAANLRTIWLP
jgi:Tol biopolymer transport system component